MAAPILVVALVVEAGLAAYCLVTRSSQNRIRSSVRIGALAAFAVLTLLSAIQWDWRWYLLAALLFVWPALGVWTLLRIHSVLDAILSAAHDPSSAAVYHLVDAPRIGLMGHSLGGESSAQTARERVAIRFFDVYLKGQGTFGVD